VSSRHAPGLLTRCCTPRSTSLRRLASPTEQHRGSRFGATCRHQRVARPPHRLSVWGERPCASGSSFAALAEQTQRRPPARSGAERWSLHWEAAEAARVEAARAASARAALATARRGDGFLLDLSWTCPSCRRLPLHAGARVPRDAHPLGGGRAALRVRHGERRGRRGAALRCAEIEPRRAAMRDGELLRDGRG